MNQAVSIAHEGFLSVFEIFGDIDLMFGAGLRGFQLENIHSEDWAILVERWITDEIPTAVFDQMEDGLRAGLAQSGYTDDKIEAIFAEAAGMTGQQLVDFISGLATGAIAINDAVAATNLPEMYRVMELSGFDAFGEGMVDVFENIDLLQARMLTSISTADQADSAARIADLIMNARQAEIQMLMQIQAIQDGINASIAGSIESLQLVQMNTYGQQEYFGSAISNLISSLTSDMDPAQVGETFNDIQGYMQSLIGTFDAEALGSTFGDNEYSTLAALASSLGLDFNVGETVGDFFIRAYEAIQGITDPLLEEDRAEVEGWADRLHEEANNTADALAALGDAAWRAILGDDWVPWDPNLPNSGGGDEPPPFQGPDGPYIPGGGSGGNGEFGDGFDNWGHSEVGLLLEGFMRRWDGLLGFTKMGTVGELGGYDPTGSPEGEYVIGDTADTIIVNVETNPCVNITGEIGPLLKIIDSRVPVAQDHESAWS